MIRTIAAEIFAGFLSTFSESLFSLTDPYTRIVVLVYHKVNTCLRYDMKKLLTFLLGLSGPLGLPTWLWR